MNAPVKYDDGAPVIDHPWVFSVSQGETFRLCKRKWAFRQIDKVPDVSGPAAELGGVVHNHLEDYLKRAIPIPGGTKAGKIAISGVKHLPLPKTPGMTVEEWFAVKVGNAYFRGKKDLEILRPSPEFWRMYAHLWGPKHPGKGPLVGDHKSTKNFKWAKTPTELLTNLQAGIYAYDAHKKTGDSSVSLLWNYLRTEGASASDPRRAVIHLPQILRVVEGAAATADEMIATHLNCKSAADVEKTESACEAFGGCSYKQRCGTSAQGILRAMIEQANVGQEKSVGLLEGLAERKRLKAAQAAEKGLAVVSTGTEIKEAPAPANGSSVLPPEAAQALEVTAKEEAVENLNAATTVQETTAAPAATKEAKPPKTPRALATRASIPALEAGSLDGNVSGAITLADSLEITVSLPLGSKALVGGRYRLTLLPE